MKKIWRYAKCYFKSMIIKVYFVMRPPPPPSPSLKLSVKLICMNQQEKD